MAATGRRGGGVASGWLRPLLCWLSPQLSCFSRWRCFLASSFSFVGAGTALLPVLVAVAQGVEKGEARLQPEPEAAQGERRCQVERRRNRREGDDAGSGVVQVVHQQIA